MLLQGPPLRQGPNRRPPPMVRQGYPSCVVPAVRSGPPPCPDPKHPSRHQLPPPPPHDDHDKLTNGADPRSSNNSNSSSGGSDGGPNHSFHHHHHHHHVFHNKAGDQREDFDQQQLQSQLQPGKLPNGLQVDKLPPWLGGPQPHMDEPLVPARVVACCLCGVLVAVFLLYLLYHYVRSQTEMNAPRVDVGNVEFFNAVYAHRVADIIRAASSEAPPLSLLRRGGSGWTGVVGVTAGPSLAHLVGSGVKLLGEWGGGDGGINDVNGGRSVIRVAAAEAAAAAAGGGGGRAAGDVAGAGMVAAGVEMGRVRTASASSASSPSSSSSLSSSLLAGAGLGLVMPRQLCDLFPHHLFGNVSGDVNHEHKTLTLGQVQSWHTDLGPGGEWSPPGCVARYRLAVVIPYRDRLAHLTVLLAHLLPILKRQQLHFKIFVVEQHGSLTFNKGRIMNAAFKEALKMYDFQCVVFHDVDLIPEDDRNMYSCPVMPRHMSVAIDEMNYRLSYNMLVGGVLNMRVEHFQQVNGYSNMYWGWGAEDDDMAYRILHVGLKIFRPPGNIARYQMIKHTKRKPTSWGIRSRLLRTAVKRYHLDGLNSVQYTVNFIHADPLYTHIMVDIGKPDIRTER